MAESFNIYLTGNLLPGRNAKQAIAALSKMMRIPEDQAAGLLRGKATLIRRELPEAQVEGYQRALSAAGVEVRFDPLTPRAPDPDTASIEEAYKAALGSLPPAPDANPVPAIPAGVETVTCPACGTVQPKRNLCIECGGNMPALLAAKEAAAKDPAAYQQHAYAPPGSRVADVDEAIDFETPSVLSLSFGGRLGRLRYLAYSLPAYLPLFIGGVAAAIAIPAGKLVFGIVLGALGLIAGLILLVRIMVLRLHDLNLSGKLLWLPLGIGIAGAYAHFLLIVFGILFVIFALGMSFAPGGKTDNDYGPPPGPNTTGVKVAATVAILLSFAGSFANGGRHNRVPIAEPPGVSQE